MLKKIRYIIEKFNIVEVTLTILFVFAILISIHCFILFSRYGSVYPGFFVYSNAMVSITQRDSWEGVKVGLRPMDIVIEVNKHKISSGIELLDLVNNFPPGTEFEYTVIQGFNKRTFNIRSDNLTIRDKIFTFYLPYFIGLLFLLMGGVVFFIRIKERANRVFLIFSALIGIFYTTGFDVNTTYTYSRIWLLYPFFGAASLHLFLIFPEERKRVKEYPALLLLPYLIVGIPVLFHEIFYNSYTASYFFFKSIPPLMGILFLLDIAILSYTVRKSASQSVKHKAKALIVAVLCASTSAVLWSFTFPLRSQYVTLDRALILSTVFPVFMTYAILKENVFDIDRFLQNTMIYVLLSAILVGVYFLTVGIAGFFTQKVFLIGQTQLENIISILAIVALFHPLRLGVQKFIKRTFYLDELMIQSGLIELLTELGKTMDIETIANMTVNWIKKNLKFDSSFYLRKEDQLVKIQSTIQDAPDYIVFSSHQDAELLRKNIIIVPAIISKKNIDPNLRYLLSAVGATVVLPVFSKNKLLGLIGIGRLYVDTFIRRRDEDAFKVIGENIGIFLDNAIHYSERTRSERLATLGKMGTMIIHEIKNPLGIIKSSVGALKNRLDLKPPEKELIQFIEEEADRINNTVRKVLDYARPPEAILCPIEIQDVLKRSVKMLEPQMQEHKINCNLKIYEGSAVVNGDANLLHQAFVNILTNSIEVMQKGGTINISLVLLWEKDIDTGKSDGIVEKMKELGVRVVKSFAGTKKVRIIIEDDGPGIKEEEKDKIFEPFYTTKQDGTGLGLAITKHIIEVHKGMIKAESGNQKGTRFIIELPVTG